MIAGSSGGHILPALAYINNLSLIKDPNNILFITNEIGKKYLGNIQSNKINKIISEREGLDLKKIFRNVQIFYLIKSFNEKKFLKRGL